MSRARPPAGAGRVLLAAALLSAMAGTSRQAAGQNAVGLHGVDLASRTPADSETTGLLSVTVDRGTSAGDWELRLAGEVWIDLRDPGASLWAPAEAGSRRAWESGELFVGLGSPEWGLSRFRTPASAFAPRALPWSSLSGPPLGGPIAKLGLFGAGGELEAVFLPARRSYHGVGSARGTWGGLPVEAEGGLEGAADYGLRFWRSFPSVDVALWWMDGGDGRAWVEQAEDGTASLYRPRMRQVGWEVEYVVGALVVRSEGALTRRLGAWHGRALAGVEWFATPYLTLLLEQGVASDAGEAESPLVDDTLLGVELVAERLRLSGGVAADPATATLHGWLAMRWTVGSRAALESEWVGISGDSADEPELALRQPRALRLGVLWYL